MNVGQRLGGVRPVVEYKAALFGLNKNSSLRQGTLDGTQPQSAGFSPIPLQPRQMANEERDLPL